MRGKFSLLGAMVAAVAVCCFVGAADTTKDEKTVGCTCQAQQHSLTLTSEDGKNTITLGFTEAGTPEIVLKDAAGGESRATAASLRMHGADRVPVSIQAAATSGIWVGSGGEKGPMVAIWNSREPKQASLGVYRGNGLNDGAISAAICGRGDDPAGLFLSCPPDGTGKKPKYRLFDYSSMIPASD